MKVVVTGSQGFIGSYVCQELLSKGHSVIGIDNYEKYGPIERPQDGHPNFTFYEGDVRDLSLLLEIVQEHLPEVIIAGAAKIGGISYFHKYAYDLMAANERIMANTFDAAIYLHQKQLLKKIIVISSSMVFENTDLYPTPEEEVHRCPPPLSTYGFQKLACEYFAKGAFEQYGVPYVIVRPFNCVGVGEEKALDATNEGLMLSHVLPDLINKTLRNQYPLEILGEGDQIRCYTNGKDIARAIRMLCENDIINDSYNISIPRATSVVELAELVWKEVYKNSTDAPIFAYTCLDPFQYDVQKRIPDVTKAKEHFGFEAEIPLEESIKEVTDYIIRSSLYPLVAKLMKR